MTFLTNVQVRLRRHPGTLPRARSRLNGNASTASASPARGRSNLRYRIVQAAMPPRADTNALRQRLPQYGHIPAPCLVAPLTYIYPGLKLSQAPQLTRLFYN